MLGPGLRVLETLGRFFATSTKGDSFCDFLFALLQVKPFPKGVYSIRQEFAPIGSKFLSYRVDLTPEENKTDFDRAVSPKSVLIHLKTL